MLLIVIEVFPFLADPNAYPEICFFIINRYFNNTTNEEVLIINYTSISCQLHSISSFFLRHIEILLRLSKANIW